MNDQEFEEAMQDAIKLGWAKKVGKDKIKLTPKGLKHVDKIISERGISKEEFQSKQGLRRLFIVDAQSNARRGNE